MLSASLKKLLKKKSSLQLHFQSLQLVLAELSGMMKRLSDLDCEGDGYLTYTPDVVAEESKVAA